MSLKTQTNTQTIGYLPDERPPFIKLVLYAIQQVIVMFPATVAVALITGFHISTTIFASGLATLCFILVTGRQIPLYYGSSFSYISAIAGIMAAKSAEGAGLDVQIQTAQFGIIMSGFVSIIAGLIIRQFGKESIEKVLPATITGPIAMAIGLTLAGNAILDASSFPAVMAEENAQLGQNLAWIISLTTLVATIFFTVHLKGFAGQLTLLFGPIVGCLIAFIISGLTGFDFFRSLPDGASAGLTLVPGLIELPRFTLPKASWAAVLAIMPIAIATIPESTAHLYQLDIYVNNLAKLKKSGKRYDISSKLGLNLIGDGIADIVSALIGGPAGTNYGENISAMAITRVFSVPVLIAAAIIAMIIACFTPLINAIYSIPQAVIGGMEIYLFGAIAAQGIAIMVDKKVNFFDAKSIALIASIMVIGVGGQYAFGGSIPFFGIQVPCIAGAAIFGIVLNLLLSIGKKPEQADLAEELQSEE